MIQKIADALWEARRTGRACEPPTLMSPGLSVAQAYQVSLANYQRRLNEGSKPLGKKVGLTSEAVQRQLGVGEPDFGWLTWDMVVPDGHPAAAADWIQPKVEGEVAFVLGRDLAGPGIGRREAEAATDHVRAAIEIIDSRVRDWRITIADTIADNASSAALVLGRERRRLAEAALPDAAMSLRLNGKVVARGKGEACLGDPLNAVVWLANALGARGETLKSGDVVLSGACGPVVPFAPGDRCEVAIDGLGSVSCAYGR